MENIISELKQAGYRITQARSIIIKILFNSKSPVTALELLSALEKEGVKVNKTTVYREVDFLLKEKIIKELDFGDGKKRYEMDLSDSHHHHVICLNCEKVEDIELKTDLDSEEKRITQEKKYKIINHSLEFFGYCPKCKEQITA
jgi:Fur family transcriptional regulator, ferric uptake regulator